MIPALNQTCQVINSTTNLFGDTVSDGTVNNTIPCKFKYITNLDTGQANREEESSAAIFWVRSYEDVAAGTVFLYDSEYYRVVKIFKMRRFDGVLLYLKCTVQRIKDVANVS